MSRHYPSKVPLPDVGNYTEDIMIGKLGFPANLDIERINIHLRSLETVRQAGGLGHLAIKGVYEDESDLKINTIGSDGTATALSTVSIETDPSAFGSTIINPFSYLPTKYMGPLLNEEVSSTIKVNLSKRDRLLRKEEAYNPNAALTLDFHARFLNRAIRRGLVSSSIHANADSPRTALTIAVYGGLLSGRYAIDGGKINAQDLLTLFTARTSYLNLGLLTACVMQGWQRKSSEKS